jgi:hypothetical protein
MGLITNRVAVNMALRMEAPNHKVTIKILVLTTVRKLKNHREQIVFQVAELRLNHR